MAIWGRTRLRQWWWVAFLFGVLMINYPFLHIFNRPALVAGIPILFLYFIIGWGLSVAVIGLYAWVLGRAPPDPGAFRVRPGRTGLASPGTARDRTMGARDSRAP